MEYAVEIKEMGNDFGTKRAVDHISLSIEKGELFALLGVNGAGKTTTIRMLTGLSRPTGGDAYVMGRSITGALSEVKKNSNLSPQETAVAPNLTVRENLQLMARIYGASKADASTRTDALISQCGMTEIAGKKAKLLSGGWQRRLSIAMALITQPQILYLDEPTLGLDVLARRELWKVIESLKGSVTIVLTTHYMEEVEALSDHVAVMMTGSVKAYGTVEELKAETGKDTLEEAFIAIADQEKMYGKDQI
ncbi:MAG: ABC transporter ATP-binding protein [Lachnospiraceae bacterium]|nr:ABC transporter ATP-binding protein [Lachnospiraceae bacterium]